MSKGATEGKAAGLRCAKLLSGHVMLPTAAGQFECTFPGCKELLSASEAMSKVAEVHKSFADLHQYHPFGSISVRAGCQACAAAEESASLILAPEHAMWLLWVTIAMHLAGTVRSSKLLLAAIYKRQAMEAEARPSAQREDIFLRLQHAILLGLGFDASTALLRSAFEAAGEGDPGAFISKWIPLKPPFGARTRAAAAIALGMKSPASPGPTSNAARDSYALRGGDMFASEKMKGLARARSVDECKAAQEHAACRIRAWEMEWAAMHPAVHPVMHSLPQDPTKTQDHEFTREHWDDESNAEVAKRVWRIDGVFSDTECDAILQAVESVTASRGGWDHDRHGNYPTTDLPLSAVPEVEVLIRTTLFRNVLLPLAQHYLPPPVLPEHLELIDCFFVKYSCLIDGEQTELERHVDGSTFSFNVLLNEPSAFEGGGTRFYHKAANKSSVKSSAGFSASSSRDEDSPEKRSISSRDESSPEKRSISREYEEPSESSGRTLYPGRGGALAHSGHVEHSGVKITSGERYILVGFVGSVVYPYTAELAEHAERDAFGKFGDAAWERSLEPATTTWTCVPVPHQPRAL